MATDGEIATAIDNYRKRGRRNSSVFRLMDEESEFKVYL
jgi:hypothetical protein